MITKVYGLTSLREVAISTTRWYVWNMSIYVFIIIIFICHLTRRRLVYLSNILVAMKKKLQITCPPSMEGSCQFMDQAVNFKCCSKIGTITPNDMYLNEHGQCAFKPIELTLVNANGIDPSLCPNVMEASREDEYLLLLFGDPSDNGAEPDLENPVYNNADAPRQALQINK